MKILITGSNGYIGSVLGTFLRNKKYNIIGIDKKTDNKFVKFNQKKCDLNHINLLKNKIKKINPDIVIHLAGESTIDNIQNKKKYLSNNIVATSNLVKICKKENIRNFIFSSTAAVYKETNKKITENFKTEPNNIYGKTKLKAEKIIKKEFKDKKFNFILFRFFNVCSSMNYIGENHNPETHLIPIAVQKHLENKKLFIYGNNFKTKDGTCVRDYIHIKDLCNAFYRAIKIFKKEKEIKQIINLGTKNGLSILQIIKFFKKKLMYEVKKKRTGDNDILVCDNKKAKKILNWKPKNSNLSKIIKDEINWYKFMKKNKINRISKY